jgi:hypothetical protein
MRATDKNAEKLIRGLAWPALTAANTLIINVDKQDFGIQASPLEFAGRIFIPKQETHITVFGSGLGIQLHQRFDQQPSLEHAVAQAFENTDWSYQKTNDLRHLVKTSGKSTCQQAEESIVMLLKVDGMSAFYDKLKSLELIPGDYPVPPPHVTLYTRNSEFGIGVHSEDELTALTKAHLQRLPE